MTAVLSASSHRPGTSVSCSTRSTRPRRSSSTGYPSCRASCEPEMKRPRRFAVHRRGRGNRAAVRPGRVSGSIRSSGVDAIVLQLGFDDALLSGDVPAASRDSRDLATLLRAAAALELDSGPGTIRCGGRWARHGCSQRPAGWRSRARRRRSVVVATALECAGCDRRAAPRRARAPRAGQPGARGAGRGDRSPSSVGGAAHGFRTRRGRHLDRGRRGSPFDEATCGCCWWWRRWPRSRASRLAKPRACEATKQLHAEINLEHNMVGASRPMRDALRAHRARRAAPTRPMLLARRKRHRQGARRPRRAPQQPAGRPAVRRHQLRGAHRDAARERAVRPREGRVHRRHRPKKGKLELADGGTLFLDEIGELPLDAAGQAAARAPGARVRARRRHAAGARRRPADRRDQPRPRGGGQGRHVPRGPVLPPQRRVARAAAAARAPRGHPAARRALRAQARAAERPAVDGRRSGGDARPADDGYDWPGNVRELENAIEQALALGASESASPPRICRPVCSPSRPCASLVAGLSRDGRGDQARSHLRAFEQAGQNHAEAARLLGVHPNYLHRLLRNFDLRPRRHAGSISAEIE